MNLEIALNKKKKNSYNRNNTRILINTYTFAPQFRNYESYI